MQFYAGLSRPWNNERGIALGVVILSALVFSAAAFAMMTMSMGRVQSSDTDAKRLRSQYAAEAGMVMAMERVRADMMGAATYPPGCPVGGTGTVDMNLDTDDNGSAETKVTITVTNCGTGVDQKISAKVSY